MSAADVPQPRTGDQPVLALVTHPLVSAATGMVWAESSLCTLACAHSALIGTVATVGDRAPCIVCRAPMCITSVTALSGIPSLVR